MPKVTYVQPDGREDTLDVTTGTSVMMAALSNSVPGILAECGGQAMCATCHVYVAGELDTQIPPVAEDEDEMLEEAASERRPTSRLSCQILMTDTLDGLVVQLPDQQI